MHLYCQSGEWVVHVVLPNSHASGINSEQLQMEKNISLLL